MKRKICIVTGTRAEYGLLFWLLKLLKEDRKIQLQILVTGMHLSTEFGLTVNSIINDNFKIDKKIEMLLSSDTPASISKSTGIGMIGFADAFEDLKPDIVVVLGDRFELLAASYAATIARIPIAHFHGGEATEGLIDEPTRHSITKMSHLHFVATKLYRKRVIQLGENPSKVFEVGGMGIDNIKKLKLLNKKTLEKKLSFKFSKKNLLVTFHPVTLEDNTASIQIKNLLLALKSLKGTNIIFTKPNSDTGGRIIIDYIDSFVRNNPSNTISFTSMGQLLYLSTLKYVDGVIGNSSSGLLEVPSFKIGTINIGDRQKGRIKAESIIDCKIETVSIQKAIKKLYSTKFHEKLQKVKNPYGTGNSAFKSYKILKNIKLSNILKKEFYDIDFKI
jgi:GDP/UDP-N,N'-diacetylbacillosamine 2-epimerase (hydrolysing)